MKNIILTLRFVKVLLYIIKKYFLLASLVMMKNFVNYVANQTVKKNGGSLLNLVGFTFELESLSCQSHPVLDGLKRG